MKNIFLIILTAICYISFGQENITKKLNEQSKKEFKASDSTKTKEVLLKAEQPSGSSIKDLNALERDRIKNMDIKKSNSTIEKNVNTNPDEFSTKPVIKGNSSTTNKTEKNIDIEVEKPISVPVTTKEKKAEIEIKATNTKKKTDKEILKELKEEKEAEIKKAKTENKAIEKSKEIKKDIDFSTQPIIKNSKIEKKETPVKPTTEDKTIKKYNTIDTTKSIKDFYFETTPISGSGSKPTYNMPNPVKKDKVEQEAKIPVSNKVSAPDYTTGKDKELKASYDKYSQEADSIRKKNKQWLDSVLNSLPISAPVMVNQGEYIEIFVSGGGLVMGVNPKIYDRLSIFPTGIIQREYKTKLQGEQREEKKISKDELTKLAQYIVDMGFFDFNKDYDCLVKDKACISRMESSPQPIPLTISVVVGQRRNKVNVALYAPGLESNWVNYPKNLEKILNAIYSVIEK